MAVGLTPGFPVWTTVALPVSTRSLLDGGITCARICGGNSGCLDFGRENVSVKKPAFTYVFDKLATTESCAKIGNMGAFLCGILTGLCSSPAPSVSKPHTPKQERRRQGRVSNRNTTTTEPWKSNKKYRSAVEKYQTSSENDRIVSK